MKKFSLSFKNLNTYVNEQSGVLGEPTIEVGNEPADFNGIAELTFPEKYYKVYKLSKAIEIPVITSKFGEGCLLLLQGDGNAAHLPTISGATQDGDDVFDYTDNMVNPILIWNYGDRIIYIYLEAYLKS